MSGDICITVLVENSVQHSSLLAEHGLSVWLESGTQRVLFDTGQGMALAHNAELLGIDPRCADAVVLSHGHYDHSGGLAWVLERQPCARVYAHPAALQPKYSCQSGGALYIGVPESVLAKFETQADFHSVTQPQKIADNIWCTGPIPRNTDFEKPEKRFYRRADTTQADTLDDDQALYLTTARGTVVILGCAHAGVINTLHYIRQITDGQPIAAVLGGMHLKQVDESRLAATLTELNALGIGTLLPGHCTGFKAASYFNQYFLGACEPLYVGQRLCF